MKYELGQKITNPVNVSSQRMMFWGHSKTFLFSQVVIMLLSSVTVTLKLLVFKAPMKLEIVEINQVKNTTVCYLY